MTENALQIYEQFGQLQQAASALYKSGYFTDAKSEAQAMVKVMAGAELGLPPFASMTGINIIQGKPAIGANVVATLVKNDRRYDYRVKQADATVCILSWFESGKQVGESSFTIAEAQAAGLATKDNWKKFPSDMLFARAITRGARRYAPGIFGGAPVYTPDELGADVDEDGVIIEGSYATTERPAPAAVNKSAPIEQGVPLLDDELVIMETPAADFFDAVTALVDRYDNVFATQAAAKKLGFKAVPKDAKARLGMYQAIKAHAMKRDAEEAAAEQNELFPDAENGAYQD